MPPAFTSWQIQFTGDLDLSLNATLYEIDLFDTPDTTVAALHAGGHRVACYLDAGTWEPFRPDAGAYPDAVKGDPVAGFGGERWLDIRQLSVLQPIIGARLDQCQAKGFDGVDFDNVDGWANDSGFPLTADDQLRFNRFLAAAAHARGLSVGLKNDLDQAAALQPVFDWALNEQCFQYHECDRLQPFVRAGKAVFVAEYELDPASFCPAARSAGLMAMRKRLSLDAWREVCW